MNWAERRSGWSKRESDARSDWDIDYGRIIHSASFRRLQGKTQILNLGDSDFYRTRLTHSMEVAQIATSITRQLAKDNHDHPSFGYLPNSAMIQAIGSTHDLGHPPFGHGGEVALNYCMRNHGGFEGNGQTLRILSRLEKFSTGHGADLTRRTLLGTLKYPVQYSLVANAALSPKLADGASTVRLVERSCSKPPKCYLDEEQDVVGWIFEPIKRADRDIFSSIDYHAKRHGTTAHKSFDCSIMDLADDVAYGIHDLEDAVALRLITREDFELLVPEDKCSDYLSLLKKRYPSESQNDVYGSFVSMIFNDGNSRKHAISRLVGYFVENCFILDKEEFSEPLLRFRAALKPEAKILVDALKRLVYDTVIRSPEVQHLEFKGQHMVIAVFEALESDPKSLLPKDIQKVFDTTNTPERIICDYVAGMTDSFLLKTYERLFSPRIGSVFDRL